MTCSCTGPEARVAGSFERRQEACRKQTERTPKKPTHCRVLELQCFEIVSARGTTSSHRRRSDTALPDRSGPRFAPVPAREHHHETPLDEPVPNVWWGPGFESSVSRLRSTNGGAGWRRHRSAPEGRGQPGFRGQTSMAQFSADASGSDRPTDEVFTGTDGSRNPHPHRCAAVSGVLRTRLSIER